MTARCVARVEVDAGTVYAQGVRSGLLTAISMLARYGLCPPAALRAELKKADATVVFNEWRASQGQPVPVVLAEETYSFIALALERAGLSGEFHDSV